MPKKKPAAPAKDAVALSAIYPSENNPRDITPEAIADVAESLKKFGWQQPIVADHKGEIVIGHTRFFAASKIHKDKKRIARWADAATAWVIHLPKETTRQEIEALKIADNITGQRTHFNAAKLALNLRKFNLHEFFTGLRTDEKNKLYQASHDLNDLKSRCSAENRKPSAAPLSYYGGKKTLSAILAEIITSQEYDSYIEAFAGGAAVAFTPVTKGIKTVILNDLNREMINFWEHCADPGKHTRLCAVAEKYGICHEDYFKYANAVYHARVKAKPEERAWAIFYTLINSMFSMAGHNFSIGKGLGIGLSAKIQKLKILYQEQMRRWQFLTRDACVVIRRYAKPTSVVYCDPPYLPTTSADVDQGHYRGYTADDFQKLLDELAETSAKFVLSSYENPQLKRAIKKHGWHQLVVRTTSSASAGGSRTGSRDRTSINCILRRDIGLQALRHEWIVTNFPIPEHLTSRTKPKKK